MPKRAQSIGQKRPFMSEHIQLIRANLIANAAGSAWELALFETALSTSLRSSDLLALRVEQVQNQAKVPVKMQKTKRVVLVELSHRAQVAIGLVIAQGDLRPSARIFPICRQTYGDYVKKWARYAGLDPRNYSTHSMRRSRPAHIYRMTNNVKVAQELLGHASLSQTGAYLGIGTEEAHAIAKEHEL